MGGKLRVKYLSLKQALDVYPAHCYYDLDDNEIVMPDKEALWKIYFLHEYVHYLRRDKWTLKATALLKYMIMIVFGLVLLSVFTKYAMITLGVFGIFVLFLYYYEEVYIQQKMLVSLAKQNIEEVGLIGQSK